MTLFFCTFLCNHGVARDVARRTRAENGEREDRGGETQGKGEREERGEKRRVRRGEAEWR
jgi:hypothetical protein